ncbi:hypothetical protein [Microbacterium hatanonis]|uniref:DUF2384 domain-containing protein n=1 Tax=Microbacterium hatanonis TaxID=404366 RepID=A0A5C8I374_9MICO|nr:hypothetical protein [Microbacterium hatanonis]TXK12343.1 hypothetical protein FVP77_02360 [Microbacterium hatanonis]
MSEDTNPWVEFVGPCYTAQSIRRKLGMTIGELDDATRDLRILALVADDGSTLYPTWQVREGEVIRGLHEILTILRTGVDDSWTWAQWLVFTPPPDDVNRSPIDELRGGKTSQVIHDAEHVAHAWAQ